MGDGYALKLDLSGALLWQRPIGGSARASVHALSVDGDVTTLVGHFDQQLLVGTPAADSAGGFDGALIQLGP
jgi:hypothetical protein